MEFSSSEFESIHSMLIEALLKEKLDSAVNLWFRDLKLISLDENEAIFISPSEFKKNIIKKRFTPLLAETLNTVLGFSPTVTIISNENGEKNITKEIIEIKEEENTEKERKIIDGYKPEYTFDSFVVGSSNNYACAFAKAVANKNFNDPKLGKEYNPFFLYGPSGVGKSHLLYAISNAILEKYPNKVITFLTGEEFSNQILEAINNKTTAFFREKYRRVDILLIDDIHFIAGKPSVQEEFFNTFNTIYEMGKQIILTSDRPPNEMKQLEDRLRSRFNSGLITDIQLPDHDLRCAIIKYKSDQSKLNLSYDIINFLAENIKSSIRDLMGVVNKLAAIQLLDGGELTFEKVKSSIKEFSHVKKETDTKRMDKIFIAISKKYGVSREDIISDKRNAEIMLPRHICVYLARTCTNLSQSQIGKIINRDRTTIISSENKIKNEIQINSDFALEINELVRQINN